jgi:hypothetical protein
MSFLEVASFLKGPGSGFEGQTLRMIGQPEVTELAWDELISG